MWATVTKKPLTHVVGTLILADSSRESSVRFILSGPWDPLQTHGTVWIWCRSVGQHCCPQSHASIMAEKQVKKMRPQWQLKIVKPNCFLPRSHFSLCVPWNSVTAAPTHPETYSTGALEDSWEHFLSQQTYCSFCTLTSAYYTAHTNPDALTHPHVEWQ